jgi:uncharacterized protein YukE
MKGIANLARIVTSRSLSSIPILELSTRTGNKEAHLVETLLETPEASQLQLVRTLYGRGGNDNTRALQRLQARVQHKLLNQLYFLDNSDPRFVVARKYELECFALLHKARILYAEGEYTLSERLLLRVMRLAKEGDFTQYALQCARLLRTMYTENRQRQRYKNITKQLTKLQQIVTWEDEAERIYSDTQLALAQTVKTRHAVLASLPDFLAQLEVLNRKAKTYNTFYFFYRLRLAYEELNGNYLEIIRITTAAAKRLREGRLNVRRFDKRFNHFMSVYAHLRGRQAVQGMKLAENYARDFHPSSSNWLYFQEHYFLLALHAEQYARAQQILLTTRRNPTYLKQREAALQRWDIYRAYADFVQPPPRMAMSRRLHMAQWVLAVPEYSRDKRGYNVAILVLQLLHFLRERDLDAVLVRVERLRKYQQRHLREAGDVRSRLFLRLLFITVERNFDPVESAERGKKLLQQMKDAPPPGEAYAEVEIIPYEHLWVLTLGILRKGAPVSVFDATPQGK